MTNYSATLPTGETLCFCSDGVQTHVQLACADHSRHDLKSINYETGAWSQTPQLFAKDHGAILQLHTERGTTFFSVGCNTINRLGTWLPDSLNGEMGDEIEIREGEQGLPCTCPDQLSLSSESVTKELAPQV